MADLISSAELHPTKAGRPLLHHSSTTSQSITSFPTVLPVLETIVILEGEFVKGSVILLSVYSVSPESIVT